MIRGPKAPGFQIPSYPKPIIQPDTHLDEKIIKEFVKNRNEQIENAIKAMLEKHGYDSSTPEKTLNRLKREKKCIVYFEFVKEMTIEDREIKSLLLTDIVNKDEVGAWREMVSKLSYEVVEKRIEEAKKVLEKKDET